jgi:DeoR/GlpR family transcriptional regulator of sugar metabolism
MDGCTVLLPPGIVQPGIYTLIGGDMAEFLQSIHVSKAFIGASPVDLKGGVSTPTPGKAPAKRTLVGAADQVVLMADATKFGHRALLPICGLKELAVVITDTRRDDVTATSLRKQGIHLILV